MSQRIITESISWQFIVKSPDKIYHVRYNYKSNVWNVLNRQMCLYVVSAQWDINEDTAKGILVSFLNETEQAPQSPQE